MQTMELETDSSEGTKRLNSAPNSNRHDVKSRFVTDEHHLFGFEKKQPGIKEVAMPGFYSESERHILTYDPCEIRPVVVPFTDRDITVCNSSEIWLKHLGFLLYALLLMFFLAYTSFGDGAMGDGGACSDDNTNQNLNICKLDDVLNDAKGDFRFLIAFVLAGYVGVSVTTWAQRRTNYAALCGNARHTNIMLLALLPMDVENAAVLETRRTMSRWVMLAYELAILKARGHIDTPEGKDYLIRLQLLDKADPDGEWNAMVPGDRHSTVFWWLQMKLVELDKAQVLRFHHMGMLCESIATMRGLANDLMSSLDRDKPFPYSAICGVLVYLNILITSTWKGVEWSTWYFSYGPGLFNQPRIWVDMILLLCWNISYAALYDLGYMLHNPFGGRRVDVPHDLIGGGIRTFASRLVAVVGFLPPFLRNKATLGKPQNV